MLVLVVKASGPNGLAVPAMKAGLALAALMLGFAPAARAEPAGETHFTLLGVVFEGVDSARANELAPTWTAMKGRQVTLKDLSKIARAVEARYAARGYPFTAVVVPPQTLEDGFVHLEVFEGHIATLEVLGTKPAARRQAAAIFEPLKSRNPLPLGALDQATLTARDVPGLQTTPLLGPGAQAGAMDLVVRTDRTPFSGSVDVTNAYSRALGTWAISAQASYAGDAVFGEQWTGQVLADPEFRRQETIHVGYSRGLNPEGITASLGVTAGRSWPTGSFADLAIASKVLNARGQIEAPLYLRPSNTIRLSGALEWTDQSTDVFSSTAVSEDRIGVLSVALNGAHTSRATQVGWNLELRQGVNLPDTSDRSSPDLSRQGGDPRATVFKGSVALEQALPEGFRGSVRVQGQETTAPLLVPDQFGLGDLTIVRGYEPSTLLGDKAVASAFELHTPMVSLPDRYRLGGFVFLDNGMLWTNGAQASQRWASSRGVGVVFELPYGIEAQVTFADANHIGALPHNDQALFVLHVPLDTGLLNGPARVAGKLLSSASRSVGKASP